MEWTYDIVYFKICKSNRIQDLELSDIISRCRYSTFADTRGIDMVSACAQFQKMEMMRTPSDKIDCITNAIDILSVRFGDSITLNTDSLLSLLISCVLHSTILNLHSNLDYANGFSFEQDVKIGKSGYILSSFEAVLEYIGKESATLIESSEKISKLLQAVETEEISVFTTESNDERFWKKALKYTDKNGRNFLGIACSSGKFKLLSFLLLYDFDKQHVDGRGNNLLHICILSKFYVAIETMLNFLSIWAKNQEGISSFEMILMEGNLELLDKIWDKINCIQNEFHPSMLKHVHDRSLLVWLLHKPLFAISIDFPLLLFYTSHKMAAVAETLMEQKRTDIDFFAQDRHGNTFLHYATEYNFLNLIQCFLDNESSRLISNLINIANYERNETPLHLAIRLRRMEIVELLLKHGADLSIKNGIFLVLANGMPNIRDLVLNSVLEKRKRDRKLAQVLVNKISTSNQDILLEIRTIKGTDVMVTVRSLQEFGFFRSQIITEHPECCVPEIRDLIVHSNLLVSAPEGGREQNSFYRVSKRLGIFFSL
jgi:ankyrin repeat protein